MIAEAITAIFGGGITGLFGTLVTSVLNFFSQREKNKHDKEMARIQIDMLKAQTDASIKIVQAQVQGAVELQDSVAFTKSQQYGNESIFSSSWIDKMLEVKGWTAWLSYPIAYIIIILFGLVDFLKSLMRPGITLYLMLASTWVTFTALKMIEDAGQKVDLIKALNLYETVVIITIYLTVSCVTWWFGDRRIAKFLMRLNDGNYKPAGNKTDDDEPTF
jgi:hypothetical protein